MKETEPAYCGHEDCQGHSGSGHPEVLVVNGRRMQSQISVRLNPEPNLHLNIGRGYQK